MVWSWWKAGQRSAEALTRVVVVNSGDNAGVSRLMIEDSIGGAGTGRVGVGEEIWSTNLRSDSS